MIWLYTSDDGPSIKHKESCPNRFNWMKQIWRHPDPRWKRPDQTCFMCDYKYRVCLIKKFSFYFESQSSLYFAKASAYRSCKVDGKATTTPG